MRGLKVAVIGAGSTYTPEVIGGFIDRASSLNLDTLCLMDISDEKLPVVAGLVRRVVEAAGLKAKVMATLSLEEALEGADYVLAQIRVGGLAARIADEKIPLKYGMIGQETTGIGGFMKGMRTIPALMGIAKAMERLCPDAWLINFSNPSGMVAEALLNHTGVKMTGLCNGPIGMQLRAQKMFPGRRVDIRYVGLNHLGFIVDVLADGVSVMPEALRLTAEKHEADSENGFPAAILEAIPAIPSYYLQHFYFHDKKVREALAKPTTRGEDCLAIEEGILKEYADETLCRVPESLSKRGGANYSTAAISLIDSMENDRNDIHIVDVRNQGAYPFMEHDDVVEVACAVNRSGVRPVALGTFGDDYIIGLMRAVKAYEKLAVKAALTGEKKHALAALMVHPLIGGHGYEKASAALEEMWAVNAPWIR
jgi:6-phospho-beta-glucosidase